MGEYQELVFEVRVRFCSPMSDASHGDFLDGFIGPIESRRLAVCGMSGQLPLTETDGVVSAWGRGSPTEADRKALLDWLQQRPRWQAHKPVISLMDGMARKMLSESQPPQDTVCRRHRRARGAMTNGSGTSAGARAFVINWHPWTRTAIRCRCLGKLCPALGLWPRTGNIGSIRGASVRWRNVLPLVGAS